MITNFSDVFAELKNNQVCKRMVAAWAVDEHTIVAAAEAVKLGIVTAIILRGNFLMRLQVLN